LKSTDKQVTQVNSAAKAKHLIKN